MRAEKLHAEQCQTEDQIEITIKNALWVITERGFSLRDVTKLVWI